MNHKMLRPFIVKVSVLVYFPLHTTSIILKYHYIYYHIYSDDIQLYMILPKYSPSGPLIVSANVILKNGFKNSLK